jgi:hypothetical protein
LNIYFKSLKCVVEKKKGLRILMVFQHNFFFGREKSLDFLKKGAFFVPNINYMRFFQQKKKNSPL